MALVDFSSYVFNREYTDNRQWIIDYNAAWEAFSDATSMGADENTFLGDERYEQRAAIIKAHCGISKPYYRALLIGRHSGELGGTYSIVGQENVTFPDDEQNMKRTLFDIMATAISLKANAVVFQNTPVLLTAALLRAVQTHSDEWNNPFYPLRFGGIVSKQPDTRPANVAIMSAVYCGDSSSDAALRQIVNAVNPRAQVTAFQNGYHTIEIDPLIPFEFVRVEWFV